MAFKRFQDERSASNIKPASAILLYFGTHFLRARLHSLVISGILHFVPPIPVNLTTNLGPVALNLRTILWTLLIESWK